MVSKKLSTHKLPFLEGLRGLSALYVVLHHASAEVLGTAEKTNLGSSTVALASCLRFGQAAVVTFIVLSGYCLMIPIMSDPERRVRGGVVGYLKRRVRRIVPPYYGAIGVSLLLTALIPGLNRVSGRRWDVTLPAFNWETIISHLLLIHDFNSNWFFRIDYPMWSIAVEWQIYFFFPLLLWVFRKTGALAMLLSALALGSTAHFTGVSDNGTWLLGCFGIGAYAAIFPGKNPTTLLALFSIVATAVFFNFCSESTMNTVLIDWGVGAGVALLILYCRYKSERRPSENLTLMVLEANPALRLGNFSYSLYLTHAPVLAILHLVFNAIGLTAGMTLFLLIGPGTVVCLTFAFLFFLVFENPWKTPVLSSKSTQSSPIGSKA